MKRFGFTLIEIVSVIALIGLMLAIIFPYRDRILYFNNLNIATKQLINDLRFSKMYALSKNVSSVYMIFDGDAATGKYDGYRIYCYDNPTNNILKRVQLPNRIEIDRNESTFSTEVSENKLEFRCDGSVYPACTIILKNNDTGEKKYVTLTIGYTRAMEVKK